MFRLFVCEFSFLLSVGDDTECRPQHGNDCLRRGIRDPKPVQSPGHGKKHRKHRKTGDFAVYRGIGEGVALDRVKIRRAYPVHRREADRYTEIRQSVFRNSGGLFPCAEDNGNISFCKEQGGKENRGRDERSGERVPSDRERVFQFAHAVMAAYERLGAVAYALHDEEQRKIYVRYDGIGRHGGIAAVFVGDAVHDDHADIRAERNAERRQTYAGDGAEIPEGKGKLSLFAPFFPYEIDGARHHGGGLPYDRCERRARKRRFQHLHEQPVEHNVRHETEHHGQHRQKGLPVISQNRHQSRGKHLKRRARNDHRYVIGSALVHRTVRAEQREQGRIRKENECGKRHRGCGEKNDGGKQIIPFPARVLIPDTGRYIYGAADPDPRADRLHERYHRIGYVYGGKARIPYVPADEKRVHHGVKPAEHESYHRRKNIADKGLFHCNHPEKMIYLILITSALPRKRAVFRRHTLL